MNLKTEKLSMCLNNRKMMKIGMIIILWFCLTGGLVVAQEKRAYTLFDADGQETDYAHMMSVWVNNRLYLSERYTIAR